MQRTPPHVSAPSGVERAPFSYARRLAVTRLAQSVADGASTATAAGLNCTKSCTFSATACPGSISAGAAFVVHEDARECSDGETGAMQRSMISQMPLPSASQCAAPQWPPLAVDPAPSCLDTICHVRSARAWEAMAAGCIAEAKRLSETDGDALARAASAILGGEVEFGLILLESYVIATCVVLYEQHQRLLSSACCPERHKTVMLEWQQHRTQPRAARSLQVSSLDVDPTRVTEAVVCRVVLQSMQLMDMMEVRRWYTVGLVLCTSPETPTGSSSSRKSRKPTNPSKTKTDIAASYVGGHDGGPSSATLSPATTQHRAQRRSSSDFSAIMPMGSSSDTAVELAAIMPVTTAASAGDGYEAPSNLWFRCYFALCESTPPAELLEGTLSSPPTPPSRACDGDSTPATRTGTTLTLPFAPVMMEGNNGSCPTNFAGEGRRRKRSRTRSSWNDRRSDRATHKSPLRSNCESEDSRCSPTFLPASTHGPAWASTTPRPLHQEETASLLLSNCVEWDVFFITAVTAFQTHHYRTCMMAVSRFLHWAEKIGMVTQPIGTSHHPLDARSEAGAAGGEAEALPCHHYDSTFSAARSPLPHAPNVPGMEYHVRLALFMQAWSSLQVGERLQFGKDVVTLLDYADDSLSYHVGCSLSLFGLPLPAANETVMADTVRFTGASADVKRVAALADSAANFSPTIQRYLYVLTESVHALTLLQLGMVEPAMRVAKIALDRAKDMQVRGCSATESSMHDDALLLDTLRNVVVITGTALEDATSVLGVTLSPHLLAYIAVSPAFFGGLCAGGIPVKLQSEPHRLLYPSNLPLYASTRQMIPFHMNRAVVLYNAGQLRGAWDDVCCAVAAVDEVVGSVEFAFSDCFPLQVYYFAFHVGFELLEALLFSDLEAAKACLSNPESREAICKKDAILQESETLSKEILDISRDMARRMLHFYPHSRLTELCQVLLSIMCGDRDFLGQAVLLSERYPHSPAAQNLLTIALCFDHHIPEAVDHAARNLQAFPHSRDIIRIHRMLQKKSVAYRFDYRGVLPILYKPGKARHGVTKRKALLILLLAANLGLLCLTVYVNLPLAVQSSEEMKLLAVRMQLPSVVPLLFAAIFGVYSIVAATGTENLVSTALTDLFFVNSALNRALFCLRCIPLVNVVNALLISFAGNNFLLQSGSATFFLYFCLSMLFVPFTTRVWFLPSLDEPDADVMSWLAILSVDTLLAFVLVVPHIALAVLEPYMFLLYYFYALTPRPGSKVGDPPPSSSIRRRLLLHVHDSRSMTPRFKVGSGSCFLHIRCLKWLYYRSHSSMETRYLAESQLEAENYRVFPMVEGEEARVLFAHVPLTPLCAGLTSTELGPSSEFPPDDSVAGVLGKDGDAPEAHLRTRANNRVDGQGVACSTPP
ncbi:hypothetical protein LSCM1_04058 [Leishmania martiniquensis]|uniref:Uncharacterized protein n=1 Tax=Leishmania martiniquensis TaxID=1580590 RepID=A0A836GJQ7_9TRYP|nr:hypothetical protein LSCM1_04058 [Leishmania martiniquensis]